jgi:lipopolysaccharide export system permease protein
MQALWLAFDEIAGKGIDVFFILKFLGYLALILTPTALPIAILLSSIMALGNLSENYEFAAIKSAGVSLKRVIAPLVLLTFLFSALNFVFLNNVYPWATLKQKNLYLNMKKKKPALALAPGAFNTDIPGYSIKFEEKYGEEKNLLKNVQIADLSANKGKIKVITAEKGTIASEEGSKYMTLILENGNYYEEHLKTVMLPVDRARMPASRAIFDTYTINIDISSFNDADSLDEEMVTEHHGMLSVAQLDSISEVNKIAYDQYIQDRVNNLYVTVNANRLYKYPDSILNNNLNLDKEILNNFNLKNKSIVIDESLKIVKRLIDRHENQVKGFKDKRKILNLYDFEYSHRYSFALACLVLFFIGAPLGSIIRKGGFGLPMILAITIFVIYFFISQFGQNLAEESAITAVLGSWLSTIILLPFGIILTRRATEGMGIFNVDSLIDKVQLFIKKFQNKLLKVK